MKSIYVAALVAAFSFSAEAKIIAEADVPDGSGATIVFHDDAGPFCMGGALLVEYITKSGDKTPGCYVARGAGLSCVFVDADVGTVPMSALREPKRA